MADAPGHQEKAGAQQDLQSIVSQVGPHNQANPLSQVGLHNQANPLSQVGLHNQANLLSQVGPHNQANLLSQVGLVQFVLQTMAE